MASTFLTSTDEDTRVAQGAFGRPVISYYPQLRAYVAERLGPEIARYFAEPMRDAGARRIDWFTDSDGPALPLADSSPDDRRLALATLRDWRRQLQTLAAQDPPEIGAEIHRILASTLSEPPETDVFVADGLPVVINWGFDGVPQSEAPPVAPPETVTPPTDGSPELSPNGRKPDLHTLCMLVALVVAALTGALNGLGVFGDRPGRPLAASAPEPNPDIASLRALQADNDHLRTDIDALQESFLSSALACLSQCSAPTIPVAPSAPPAAPTPQQPPGAPLIIPDGAAEDDDLSFLEGTWRSTSESLRLTFTNSDRPDQTITVEYNLNTEGDGTRIVTMQDGTDCTGAVSARFDTQQTLVIEEIGPAECGGGLQVIPYVVSCQVDGIGLADCALTPRDRDGADSVATELRRVP